ncbi:MAG: hypothetical protein K8L99_09905 [Anaerolineae bacterium]|nr:hypothetical protein [Anaerolineae bacterium]
MPSRQTILILVLAFIFGLIWAYAISPTIYYNGDPSQLDQSWQNEWVINVAARYERAQTAGIPSDELRQQTVRLLAAVDNPLGIANAQGLTDPDFLALAQEAQPGKAAPSQPSLIGNLLPFIIGSIVIIVLGVIISLIGRILIYPNLIEPQIRRLRGGTAASDEATRSTMDSIRKAKAAEKKAKETDLVDELLGAPMVRRMSVYIMGRGSYDDQIEIEDANNTFYGEAGATVAETIGEGTPDKVTAVEVWVFDKEDFVRTVNAVFASEYAYNDPAIRSRLEPKGEVLLIAPGATVTLETNLLKLKATVVEMSYGEGPLPPHSYFDNVTIEFAVWLKQPGSTPSTPAAPPMPAMQSTRTYPVESSATAPYNPPPPAMPQPQQPPPPPVSYPEDDQPTQGQPPQAPPPPLPPLRQQDDDPFDGTADFTPINRN